MILPAFLTIMMKWIIGSTMFWQDTVLDYVKRRRNYISIGRQKRYAKLKKDEGYTLDYFIFLRFISRFFL